MSTKLIAHDGQVVRTGKGAVEVSIEARSACAACHARSLCTGTDSQSRTITVRTPQADRFAPGETVRVTVRRSTGLKLVGAAYLLPLLLVLAILLTLTGIGMNEAETGLLSLGGGAVYFLILYIFRRRFSRKIDIEIEKI